MSLPISQKEVKELFHSERLSVEQWTDYINKHIRNHMTYKYVDCFLKGSDVKEVKDYCCGRLEFCRNFEKALEIFKKSGYLVEIIKPNLVMGGTAKIEISWGHMIED